MPRISADDAGINDVNLTEQTSDPTPPAAGTQVIYTKSGGVFVEDSAGSVTGPLGAGGATTPGGSDKNVQYNNSSSFGGIANNATATDKFLRQVSSGTPSFEQVTDADLSISNITTNNASTGAHGFLKQLDNNAAHFLDGQGNWTTPAGAGDVTGPGSATGGDIVTFNGGTGKSIQDSGVAISTDGTFATNSNAKVPTEQASKTYTDTSIANITPTGTIVQGTFIVSGCQVTYSGTNLDYIVAAGQYYIQGTLYTIAQATVTLAAADTQDRIDVIYANTSQAVGSITGTAGTNPSEPSYDPTTQIPLRFVIVYANSSTPSGVTTETIYQDNAGAPTEWAWTTSGSGFNVNSTNNPYTGTKDIEGTTVTNGSYAKGIKGSSGTIDLANYQQLVFYLRFKAAFASNRVLQCQWFASGVAKGNPLVITQGQFGLNGSNTTTYQAVIIPALQFAVPAGTAITELRFTDSGGSIGFYLDAITLISESGSTGGSGGITQQQADARYAQRANNLSDLSSAGSARTNLGLGALATLNNVTEATISLSNVTTDDATTSQHGFAPKGTVGTSQYWRQDWTLGTPAGAGDVVGPGSATDNAVARFDLTTGKLIQNSLATVDDSGGVNIPTGQTYNINSSPHAHAHSATTGITANDHHNQSHDHSASGDGTALAPATLTIPSTTSPAQTAEGSAVWDSDDDKLTIGTGAARKTLMNTDTAVQVSQVPSSLLDAGISLVVDGGGVAITNETKFWFAFPWSGTLTAWDLVADQSGTITFDVKDTTYGSAPGGSSIFSTVPALSSAQRNQASSLSISITKGHWAEIVITNAATITKCTLALYITRT